LRPTFNKNGGSILRLLREPARWCAIFGLYLVLLPTVALLAVSNLQAKVFLTLSEALADALDHVR
jgi:hypothetical protein